jgi:hypothetical protein
MICAEGSMWVCRRLGPLHCQPDGTVDENESRQNKKKKKKKKLLILDGLPKPSRIGSGQFGPNRP